MSDHLTLFGEDPNVTVSDQHGDDPAAVAPSNTNVEHACPITEGDFAVGVDFVLADPLVRGPVGELSGCGLDAGVEGRSGCLSIECSVGTDVVVVVDEGVELGLQLHQVARRGLFGQELLHGLVEPLDLAAGLGVVGT